MEVHFFASLMFEALQSRAVVRYTIITRACLWQKRTVRTVEKMFHLLIRLIALAREVVI